MLSWDEGRGKLTQIRSLGQHGQKGTSFLSYKKGGNYNEKDVGNLLGIWAVGARSCWDATGVNTSSMDSKWPLL